MITPGHVFGRLTVLCISRRRSSDGRKRFYNCVCACGRRNVVLGALLFSGRYKPCGCELVGQRFGWLTVLKLSRLTRKRKLYHGSFWLCLCACGKTKHVTTNSLRTGTSKSCGCYSRKRATKHGMHGSAEYSAWHAMLQRCLNPKTKNWLDYGGRGITVCPRWQSRGFLRRGFRAFIADMGKRPTRRHSLERINVNLGYCPTNCKWATRKEQANNKRTSVRNRQKQSTEELIEQGLDY